jgi:cytosine/adenosine deaminase-related metal-dependent hydrolase
MRFEDPEYAARIAARYLDLTAACGTTTICTYCTIHPGSVEAIFAEAQRRGHRLVAGKTCMDRDTAPDRLREAAAAGCPLLHKPVHPAKLRSSLRWLTREATRREQDAPG